MMYRKYTKDFIDENITRDKERNLAIKLLDEGFFWLNNTLCEVCSIERNERHYFIKYKDRIGSNNVKTIIVSQLKKVKANEQIH